MEQILAPGTLRNAPGAEPVVRGSPWHDTQLAEYKAAPESAPGVTVRVGALAGRVDVAVGVAVRWIGVLVIVVAVRVTVLVAAGLLVGVLSTLPRSAPR